MLDTHIQRAECLLILCSGCDRCVLNPTPPTLYTSLLTVPTKHSSKLKNFAQHLNSKGLAEKAERRTARNDNAEAKEAAEKERQAAFTSLTAPPAPVIF